MQTLSFGYKMPENSDTGDVFWDALAFDINRLNNHNHDGLNSSRLSSGAGNIDAASWSAVAGVAGLYQQTVIVPTGFSYDTAAIWFKLSTGEYVYPSVERVSSSSYKVYTNDNSKTYVAYYR